MKKNIFSFANIIRYIWALIIILNLVAVYFMSQFAYKYVYNTFYVDENTLFLNTQKRSETIDLVGFEKTIDSLQDKTGVRFYSIMNENNDEESTDAENFDMLEEEGHTIEEELDEVSENEEKVSADAESSLQLGVTSEEELE